jgi:hypothetical protein
MRDSIAPIGAAVNAFFRALRHDECFPRDKHKDDTSHDLGAPCDGRCEVRPRLQQPDELLAEKHRRERGNSRPRSVAPHPEHLTNPHAPSLFVTGLDPDRANFQCWKEPATEENEMANPKFDRPVAIFTGLGFPHEIESVLDAYHFLLEWKGIPDLDQRGAMEVCRKALSGARTGHDARKAFQRFARNRGIVADLGYGRAASSLAEEWLVR